MSMTNVSPTNQQIAELLEQIAELLEDRGDNLYRVRAYVNAAWTVREADHSLAQQVHEEGGPSLKSLPGIGDGLARLITNYVMTGRCPRLEQLLSTVSIETQMQLIPGIGPALAARISDALHVPTLEALETAAWDGRLRTVHGFGRHRVGVVRETLPALLERTAQHRRYTPARAEATKQVTEQPAEQPKRSPDEQPPVELLLALDEEYRQKAEAGELRQIAPRRFNPTWQAWLPVMRVDRNGWSFVVLYSNTAQAHRLNKTHDWVIIYVRPAGDYVRPAGDYVRPAGDYVRPAGDGEIGEQATSPGTRQQTVVTETTGKLAGQRVVRGREGEVQPV